MNLRQVTFPGLMLACGCLLAAWACAGDDGARERKLDGLMAATARTDPDSPAILEGLLEHVDSLLQAHEGRCEGLEEAQTALDMLLLLHRGPAGACDASFGRHLRKRG